MDHIPCWQARRQGKKHCCADGICMWCQTSGYLETPTGFSTFHLGFWHCVNRANDKQTPWQNTH